MKIIKGILKGMVYNGHEKKDKRTNDGCFNTYRISYTIYIVRMVLHIQHRWMVWPLNLTSSLSDHWHVPFTVITIVITKHYFIHCKLFVNQRKVMLNNIRDLGLDISLNNILYGNSDFAYDVNCSLFAAVHKHIRNTKRFV